MHFISEIRNNIYDRQELELIYPSEKKPGKKQIENDIAQALSRPSENIEVNKIEDMGDKNYRVFAYVYDTLEKKKDSKKSKEDKEKEQTEKEVVRKKNAESDVTFDSPDNISGE